MASLSADNQFNWGQNCKRRHCDAWCSGQAECDQHVALCFCPVVSACADCGGCRSVGATRREHARSVGLAAKICVALLCDVSVLRFCYGVVSLGGNQCLEPKWLRRNVLIIRVCIIPCFYEGIANGTRAILTPPSRLTPTQSTPPPLLESLKRLTIKAKKTGA